MNEPTISYLRLSFPAHMTGTQIANAASKLSPAVSHTFTPGSEAAPFPTIEIPPQEGETLNDTAFRCLSIARDLSTPFDLTLYHVHYEGHEQEVKINVEPFKNKPREAFNRHLRYHYEKFRFEKAYLPEYFSSATLSPKTPDSLFRQLHSALTAIAHKDYPLATEIFRQTREICDSKEKLTRDQISAYTALIRRCEPWTPYIARVMRLIATGLAFGTLAAAAALYLSPAAAALVPISPLLVASASGGSLFIAAISHGVKWGFDKQNASDCRAKHNTHRQLQFAMDHCLFQKLIPNEKKLESVERPYQFKRVAQ